MRTCSSRCSAAEGAALRRGLAACRRWLARALHGLNGRVAAMVAAVCAVWTLQMTVHDALGCWGDVGCMLLFLEEVGGTFATAFLTAIVMGLPLLAVGNLGPPSGWRRVAALAATVAIVAFPGAILREAYMLTRDDEATWSPVSTWGVMFWFRYAQQAALITVLAEFHRNEARHVHAMHEAEFDRLRLEREMTEARLQVLQAQIEPHFLFNTLANVRRLYQTDHATARRMLDNLMHYLEVALPRMRASTSTVEREVGLAAAYLDLQSVRMGHRLAFEIDVPPELGGLALPSMMLLTLVENAIKHGLGPLPEGGRVVVRARQEGGRLQLAVNDDGGGFRASSGGGTGLANIRARLAMLHGEGGRLSLVENRPRGVISALVVPAYRAEAEGLP